MSKLDYVCVELMLRLRAASPKVARECVGSGSVSCLVSRGHRRRRHRRMVEGETLGLLLPAVPLRLPAGQSHKVASHGVVRCTQSGGTMVNVRLPTAASHADKSLI
jgi:hypothetical protein